MLCGGYSECEILEYTKSFHLFYRNIKVLDEQYIFDWEKCAHRAVLHDHEDVTRYKKEQVETGILSVPYYQNMKPIPMALPQKVPTIKIVYVILISLILGVLLMILFEKLGILFVF